MPLPIKSIRLKRLGSMTNVTHVRFAQGTSTIYHPITADLKTCY